MLTIAKLALLAACPQLEPQPRLDLLVYGGTASGAIAAVQAAAMGHRVLLIEASRHLGGMSSGGLGATDIGNKAAIGGLARAFYRRIRAHYDRPFAWTREARADFAGPGHAAGEDGAWTFEPHVAEQVLRAMLAEAGVEVHLGDGLDLRHGVVKEGASIQHIVTRGGRTFAARAFVDASYEGDLMAKAGVHCTIGREPNARHGESLAGVQTAYAVHHQLGRRVDPFVVPGDPSSGLLPGVHGGGPGEEGTGDARVQAYCFRLCTTDVPENRLPWTEPDGYDAQSYELLLRLYDAGETRTPWHPVLLPNRKTDTNNNGPFSTDWIGGNAGYVEADWDERARIVAAHRRYQQGLLWTLATSPRVPLRVRQEVQEWGLAKDEVDPRDPWPHQLYVREARRMLGAVVMTERHCRGLEEVDDPVGLAAYGMDSHHVQRYVAGDGSVRNEGDVQVHGFSPYGISRRAIEPERAQCTNLVVPVCLSASHIAYGSIRMEPVFLVLGQAAATLACLALDRHSAVQDVPYAVLAARLAADGQVLRWPGEKRVLRGIDPRLLEGIVVDDRQAELTGTWQASSAVAPHLGVGYVHDGDARGGHMARFAVSLDAPGTFEVRLGYTPHPDRASNAQVVVHSTAGRHELHIDQRRVPAYAGVLAPLGVFAFARTAVIVVSDAGADGHVVVDGVQLVRR